MTLCVSNSSAGSYPFERSIWTDFLQSLRLVRKRQVHWIYFHPLSIPTVTYNKIPLSSWVDRYMYPTWAPRTTLLVQACYLGEAKFPTVFRCSRSKDNVSTRRFSSGSMTQQKSVFGVLSCAAGRRRQLLLNVEHLKVHSRN